MVHINVPTRDHDFDVKKDLFQDLEAVRSTVIITAKELDKKFSIVDRMKSLDENFKVTERAQNAYNNANVQNVITSGLFSIKAIDDRLSVSKRGRLIANGILAFSVEVDRRLGISATTEKLMVGIS